MQGNVAAHGGVLDGAGIDNIAQVAAFHQAVNLIALGSAQQRRDGNAHGGDGLGGAGGGIELQPQLTHLPGQAADLVIVAVLHADQDAAAGQLMGGGQLHAGGGEALEHGFRQGLAQPQHLAGGFHLRPQDGVGVSQLLEGEHRHLHGVVRRRAVQSGAVAQVRQLLPQHDARGQVHHGHIGHLADVGNGAGSPGVHLDHIQLVLKNQVLDVHQPPGADGQGQLFRALANPLQELVAEIVGGIDGDGVPAVDAGPLDVLHDAGDQYVLPVGDHVHLQLGAGHVFIHQHRVLNAAGENAAHILLRLSARAGDGHVLAADHIGGPQQHRVAQSLCRFQRLLQGVDAPALGPADAEALQDGVKAGPVLRHVNAVGRGAQNVDAQAVQILGKLDCGLAAEGHHHADGLLHPENVAHILGAQGLKIQPVGGVIVGGDGLRVVVDNDHVIAQLPQGPDAVNAAVVKLDALTDADGAGAQHHHHRPPAAGEGGGLAGFIEGGVEVGGLGVKLGGAGIHHLVAHVQAGQLRHASDALKGGVRVAQGLGLFVFLAAESLAGNAQFKLSHGGNFMEEPAVNAGDGVNFLHADAGFQRFKDGEQPPVVLLMEPLRH